MIALGCKYDPSRDIEKVSPFGAIDLCQAFVTGKIPSQIEGSETEYNGMDDPAAILGKPEDVFEAERMVSHINNFSKEDVSESKE